MTWLMGKFQAAQCVTALVVCLGLNGLAGCGGSGSTAPKYTGGLVPVKGTLTLDGEPVSDATINFLPDGTPPKGFSRATGLTDSTGKYQARTDGRTGVPPGRYRVSFNKMATATGEPFKEDLENGLDMEQARLSGQIKQFMPAKYSDPLKPQFTIEIAEDQSDAVDFALKSK